MKTKLLLSLLFIGLHFIAFAQFRCGFDELHHKKLKNDLDYRARIKDVETGIQKYLIQHKNRLNARELGTTSTLYTIPVVVHVVHTGDALGSIYNPTDATIQSAIDYLNQVYNGSYPGTIGAGDLQIQFALAVRDPNCNPTTGIERINGATSLPSYAANGVNANNTNGEDEYSVKSLSRWSPSDYYNIWVVNKIDGMDGTSGTFIGGYAYFPGTPADYDGTIMLATQIGTGKKTLPHEIGHAFGLYHPFEDPTNSPCPPNTNCSQQGDLVCDTDPVTQPAGFACRSGLNSCSGQAYNDYTEKNYMNYTNCYSLFTPGQKSRMLAAAASIYRLSLTTSAALQPTNTVYPYPNAIAPSCTPGTNAPGLSADAAGILNVQVNNKNFASSSTPYDGGYVDGTIDCIKLTSLNKGATYTFKCNVLSQNTHQVRAWIDFNNDGVFNNATEQIHYNSSFGAAQGYVTTGSFTVPASVVTNTVLRMRIIDELIPGLYNSTVVVTTIANGCHSPQYGQVEDYPIYIANTVTLPITLADFTGQKLGENGLLKWSTSAEQNTKSFEIEKSVDGINFSKIGVVKAAGNSSVSQSYSFTDLDLNEDNYYRLRTIDIDGSATLSKIVQIKDDVKQQRLWVTNPISTTISINLSKKAGKVQLQLLNATGAVIATKELSGITTYQWNVSASLSAGTYFLKAIIDQEVITKKLIKQ